MTKVLSEVSPLWLGGDLKDSQHLTTSCHSPLVSVGRNLSSAMCKNMILPFFFFYKGSLLFEGLFPYILLNAKSNG